MKNRKETALYHVFGNCFQTPVKATFILSQMRNGPSLRCSYLGGSL